MEQIEYTLIRSNRRSISLEVKSDLSVVVRAPRLMPKKEIELFVEKHREWIKRQLSRRKQKNEQLNAADPKQLKQAAMTTIPEKVIYYSRMMGLTPTDVKITSARARFGSCNAKNSLCFSWQLMLYPDEAIDYVVVHELAHIKYKNHSKAFYALIEQYLPDYKQRIAMLRQ